ncbi:MAG: V-type ATP synthase subunit E [Treponemataceae bacterium]|nr:V-type ATP synthase subunit E [Treponemataceae bacterium]
MDVQLQELIDKIKRDGVASAEQAASGIVAEAEKKAAAIIGDAQKKADDLLRNAKAEIDRLEKAGEDALAQASRNMLLGFRDSLVAELDALVQSETEKAYTGDVLKALVPETVKAWSKNSDAAGLSVILSEKDCKALEAELKSALKSEIAAGLEVKADKSLSAGFRIGVNNGEAYYDYSAEAVAELFSTYLNPRIAGIMKDAAKGSAV